MHVVSLLLSVSITKSVPSCFADASRSLRFNTSYTYGRCFVSPLAYASIGADSGLARQSASWYCFSASTPQKCFSRYANENFGNCNTRAACPVSNMFTTYTPKSRCNHLTS